VGAKVQLRPQLTCSARVALMPLNRGSLKVPSTYPCVHHQGIIIIIIIIITRHA
jgi:hypothetical protein